MCDRIWNHFKIGDRRTMKIPTYTVPKHKKIVQTIMNGKRNFLDDLENNLKLYVHPQTYERIFGDREFKSFYHNHKIFNMYIVIDNLVLPGLLEYRSNGIVTRTLLFENMLPEENGQEE